MRKLLITIGLITGAGSLFAGPIHDAASNGDLNAIASFVNEGGNIDEENDDGSTPLISAVSDDQILAVNFLISLGAKIDAVNEFGDTALIKSLRNKNSEIALKLIASNASLNEVPESAGIPIGFAALYDNIKVLEVILSRGINVNQKDSWGWAAIHYVALSDEDPISAANLLIDKNVNLNELTNTDINGNTTGIFTPLDLANQSGRGGSSVYKLLKENGAKTGAELLEDRLTALEQKVEKGSTGNTNPTDEWPRKLWEVDLPNTSIDHLINFRVGIDSSYVGEFNGVIYWISNKGQFTDITDHLRGREVPYFTSNIIIAYTYNSVVKISKENGALKISEFKKARIKMPNQTITQPLTGLSIQNGKATSWDFTPPTLAATDQEGGNNGGNKAMSRLSIGTSGPDISIATDGKLGGPAVLQKSNDLKNWRKLSDVPADSTDLLITPRDSGNEFFRLKRVGE